MKKMLMTNLVLAAGLLLAAVLACTEGLKAAAPPGDIFKTAVAVWHMGDAKDSTGKSGPIAMKGKVKLGVELAGAERKASLRRGGDGRAGRFEGGWLVA